VDEPLGAPLRKGGGVEYEIRVLGRLSPALRAAFPAMHCKVTQQTVIHGRLSSNELRFLLDRMDKLGLMIVDVYRFQLIGG
jgi:hypothetical protein